MVFPRYLTAVPSILFAESKMLKGLIERLLTRFTEKASPCAYVRLPKQNPAGKPTHLMQKFYQVWSTPDLFYKKESQEKTLLQWPDFFLLRSPLD